MPEKLRQKLLDEAKVKAAADFCADVFKDGAVEATAERVADHVTKETWNRLKRKWRRGRCRWLNEMAKIVLAGKAKYHELGATAITKMLRLVIGHKAESAFVRELATNLPLPGDAKFVAVAQGIRIIGIWLCVVEYSSPERCFCFEALALQYGKEATKSLLIAEGELWTKQAGWNRLT
ncbi:hypothetical protein GCM10023321_26030 [Pseudonocardia eucalypti]|uniref:Uncharacterized protein n=1 Tax=Pseudonocardia eucalypti TaxID=648755 RepID=A0ABP9Q3W0_9PSEU|nr:hypothetical protein [Pseudonocardia eucalypti]